RHARQHTFALVTEQPNRTSDRSSGPLVARCCGSRTTPVRGAAALPADTRAALALALFVAVRDDVRAGSRRPHHWITPAARVLDEVNGGGRVWDATASGRGRCPRHEIQHECAHDGERPSCTSDRSGGPLVACRSRKPTDAAAIRAGTTASAGAVAVEAEE